MERVDAVVIGAGLAGLACARMLSSAGQRVVVLEAKDRIGGRLHTMRRATGEVVELGAQVLHAADAGTLDVLLRQAGIETRPLATDAAVHVVEGRVRWDAATLSSRRPPPPWLVEQRLAAGASTRGTVADALDALPAPSRTVAWAWMEQVVGGDLRQLDVGGVALGRGRWAPGGERVVVGGLDQLAELLADGVDVRTGAPVEHLRWSGGGVEAGGGQRIGAGAAVVTLPPSVVLAGRLVFEPGLPLGKWEAAALLASGDALVLVLETTVPARRSAWVLLVDPPGGLWRTVAGSRVVVGHIKGPAAAGGRGFDWSPAGASTVAALVDEELGDVRSVEGCDWGADPWAGGAYSLPVPGAAEASRSWAAPLDGVLFFAGEASAGGQVRGLVQGALASGRRAAREVLDCRPHG
jgi:monoamine oxidase